MDKGATTEKPQRPAEVEEVSQAIAALETADWARIDQFARNRIRRIGRRSANGRTGEDLVQEVFRRMLDGTRNWYPARVDLKAYLFGAMRSVSSAWASHHDRNRKSSEYATVEADMISVDDEGNPRSPFDMLSGTTASVEVEAIAAEAAEQPSLADRIESSFLDDEEAALILIAFQDDDMNGPQIQQELEMTEKQYRAAVRRIKRRSNKLADEDNAT